MTGPVIVMGIAGAGKSTVGRALAERLGWRFVEGDDLHPPANRAKLAAGIPLDDADRLPWLHAVAAAVRADPRTVATCSALRRAYRDVLRAQAGPCRFLNLRLVEAEARRRVASRMGHFMPASLVADQWRVLEAPDDEEDVVTLDATLAVQDLVARTVDQLGLTASP